MLTLEANAGTASQLLPPLQGEGRGEIQQEKGNEKKLWKNKTNIKAGAQERIKRRKKYTKKGSSSRKKPVSSRTEKGNRTMWWNKQKNRRKREKKNVLFVDFFFPTSPALRTV